jgi:molybdenum cofactor cytidylyltransferase
MTIGIIIAAAGRGERFTQAGGNGNKLNALWQGRSVFERTLHQALASKMPVQVVTRPDNHSVQHICHINQIPVITLSSPGLGDSIAVAVTATSDWNGWLIHLADMPFVTPDVFLQVATALGEHDIVRPCHQQQPGHPVGFSAALRNELCQLRGDLGARELLRTRSVHQLAFDQPAVVQDIDLPSQLPVNE